MNRNVGGNDRLLRLGLGGVLLIVGGLSVWGGSATGEGLGTTVVVALVLLVGAVFLVTGLVQRCPINAVLGINTCDV